MEFCARGANVVFRELIHQSEEELGVFDMLIWLPQIREGCAERREPTFTGQCESCFVAEKKLVRDQAPHLERIFGEDALLLR